MKKGKKKRKGGSKTSHQEKIRGKKSTIKGFKQVLSGSDGKMQEFRIK